MSEQRRWTAEDEGRVVFDAIKQAHMTHGTALGREWRREAEREEAQRLEQETHELELENARLQGRIDESKAA